MQSARIRCTAVSLCLAIALGMLVSGCATSAKSRADAEASSYSPPPSADALFGEALKHHNEADRLFGEGQLTEESEPLQSAIASYDRLLELYPHDPRAPEVILREAWLHHNAADTLFTRGKLTPKSPAMIRALEAYDRFLRQYPHDSRVADVRMRKSLLYTNAGRSLSPGGAAKG